MLGGDLNVWNTLLSSFSLESFNFEMIYIIYVIKRCSWSCWPQKIQPITVPKKPAILPKSCTRPIISCNQQATSILFTNSKYRSLHWTHKNTQRKQYKMPNTVLGLSTREDHGLATIIIDIVNSHGRNHLVWDLQWERNWLATKIVHVVYAQGVLQLIGRKPIVAQMGHHELHPGVVAGRSIDQQKLLDELQEQIKAF